MHPSDILGSRRGPTTQGIVLKTVTGPGKMNSKIQASDKRYYITFSFAIKALTDKNAIWIFAW